MLFLSILWKVLLVVSIASGSIVLGLYLDEKSNEDSRWILVWAVHILIQISFVLTLVIWFLIRVTGE